jgi:hypothetical protein
MIDGLIQITPVAPVRAYALPGHQKVSERSCHILPPSSFTVESFISDFTGINLYTPRLKSDPEELRQKLFEYVMLHEARHCDQPLYLMTATDEADADLYALRVLEARGTDPVLLKEIKDIVLHSRALRSIKGTSHSSADALAQGHVISADMHETTSAFDRLGGILDEAQNLNKSRFPAGTPDIQKKVSLIVALQRSGIFSHDKPMMNAMARTLEAFVYFNKLSPDSVPLTNVNIDKLNVNYLRTIYKPVPDKLSVPAPR